MLSGYRSHVVPILALGLALLAPHPSAAQQGPAAVIVAPVIEREIADTSPVIARLVGTVESLVAARVQGVVAEVGFKTGESVATGDVLARLDDELFQIQYTNAEAALAAADAAVEVARARSQLSDQALQRAAGLKGSVAFSRGSFEDLQRQAEEARSEISRAQAQVGVARAAVARAAYDLEHAQISAPFAGVVVERMAQPGQYIALGDPVARLLDTTRLEIEADMPVDLVAGVTPGRRMEAIFDGGYTASAEVRVLLPVETTSTRTRAVRLSVEGAVPESATATGRAVTLRVPISAPRTAPVLPKDALVQQAGGWIVFVADDGQASPRHVGLGQSAGEFIEVVSGVSVGEHVVVRGNERLRPGQPVAPRLADGTSLDAANGTSTEPETPAAGPAPETDQGAEPASVDKDAQAAVIKVPPGAAAAATRENAASGG
ncbi:MAG: efflux RND transporter periplasmic adaptor subunit [Pseudomonadota bacterium]